MALPPLDALLAVLPQPTLAIAPGERIVAANDPARHLLGQGIVGRHFITALRQPAMAEAVELCLRDDRARTVPYLSSEGDTEASWDVHLRRMPDSGVVVLQFQDVTQMTQAGQMRRDFVANVSHELRTPVTSMIGFIDTLRGAARDDADARARFLAIMAQEAERMNRLVGDLLSLSRVEAQERVRPTDSVDLAALLATTLRTLGPLAEEAGVALAVHAGEGPLRVPGDADQLQQVCTNLVENAIKYGGAGGRVDVLVEAVANDPTLRGPALRIAVRDYGPGIESRHLPRLTERFYRADNHRSRALGGTGLGLAIVKHILNRHRGRLKVQSEPGHGATFTAILPAAPGKVEP